MDKQSERKYITLNQLYIVLTLARRIMDSSIQWIINPWSICMVAEITHL